MTPGIAIEVWLVGVALALLAPAGLALPRLLRGPSRFDRIMAAQLIGTVGIAVAALLAVALDIPGGLDVALVLALLAEVLAVAFVKGTTPSGAGDPERADPQ